MATTYFFYDLETSGLNPRDDRIMQFAGIRTDADFNIIGEPYNLLVALNDDTLPSPSALMVTGITPQKTISDGYTESQFAKIFIEEICSPDTILLGYNNIRFDDEFIRALLWRNFYDPYEWSYKDNRSRWDMLDVVRLTRALRPENIKWPTVNGVAVNKLELISKINNLEHTKAHDALSDVEALIAVTKLIAKTNNRLFNYLLKMRNKKEIMTLVNVKNPKPFVYASGRYDAEYNKTTVAYPIAMADYDNMFVYDLRYNPENWINKSNDEIIEILQTPFLERDKQYTHIPVKKIQPNRAPAVAPIGVLEQNNGWNKIKIKLNDVENNIKILKQNPDFIDRIAKILLKKPDFTPQADAESKLYDGFINNQDKLRSEVVRNLDQNQIKQYTPEFEDSRLKQIYPRYKARNYPNALSSDERIEYDEYRKNRLNRQLPGFLKDLTEQSKITNLSSDQKYVLEELNLWMESILPDSDI